MATHPNKRLLFADATSRIQWLCILSVIMVGCDSADHADRNEPPQVRRLPAKAVVNTPAEVNTEAVVHAEAVHNLQEVNNRESDIHGADTTSAASSPPCPLCVEDDNVAGEENKDLAGFASLGFEPSTPWTVPADRPPIPSLDASFTDQDQQQGELARLVDRPVALSFFYTRCTNSMKCSAAVSQTARLQDAIQKAGLTGQVRLLMITYEPQHDTPQRLRHFGTQRGVQFDEFTKMLRVDQPVELIDALKVPVSYNGGWVNIHGVALFLIDARGRLVRKYHTLMWDNDAVIEDLRRLTEES